MAATGLAPEPTTKGMTMGFLDDAKKKAEELAKEHPDQVEKLSDGAISKAGGLLDGATGGKYADKIDQAEDKADDALGH